MKDWFIEHTEIDAAKYDSIINCDKVVQDSQYNSKDKLQSIMRRLMFFTLNRPTFLTMMRYRVRKKKKGYSISGINFELFFDFAEDKQLFSLDRIGNCHIKSFQFCMDYNYFEVVTAICTDPFKGNDILHSFLVRRKNDREYVYDYTFNVIIPKEQYYRCMKVREVKTISHDYLKYLINLNSSLPKEIRRLIDIREVLSFPEEFERIAKNCKKKSKDNVK